MAFLIGLALLALFAMALLSPYGRRVLAVMAATCAVLVTALLLLVWNASRLQEQQVAKEERERVEAPAALSSEDDAYLARWVAAETKAADPPTATQKRPPPTVGDIIAECANVRNASQECLEQGFAEASSSSEASALQ